jgi:DNA-binding beta-propeller fold protein YncE
VKVRRSVVLVAFVALALAVWGVTRKMAQEGREAVHLATSKTLLLPAPGGPQKINSFPIAAAISPDGRYLAILNNGYGTPESHYQQSIAVMDLTTNQVMDFPDVRLGQHARQTYFLGLAFSPDGAKLYASMASLTDPTGKHPGDTGNGIAVYRFQNGQVTPESFLPIPLAPLDRHKKRSRLFDLYPSGKVSPYPAGIAVLEGGKKLLVAENLSDDAIVLDLERDKVLERFPLSQADVVPAEYPYGVVATRDGMKGFCSLWNDSAVAELDLRKGRVTRLIRLDAPASPVAAGSHPTALLLSRDEKTLYVALSNSDRVAVVDTASGQVPITLSTDLPGQKYGGTYPMGLALSADGRRLFVADAAADAVAVFDTAIQPGSAGKALGFIPAEWYPTAVAVRGDDLLIVSGKGEGTGPNSHAMGRNPDGKPRYPYIAALLHGSVARVSIPELTESRLAAFTREVEESNLMSTPPEEQIHFQHGANPIRHVIYIIKENRTYDQIFGDLKPANGDPALVMYGEETTPNEHALARQFGILDNFYCSGEVSGDGHVWSTAAINSDYNEKTWEVGYRSHERTYDYEGVVMEGFPFVEDLPDVDEPGPGYIWADAARHGLTHRNYGEFVATRWCNEPGKATSPRLGMPPPAGEPCKVPFIRPGQPLPPNVGEPHGSPSPWPWPIPMIARDVATKPELAGHFDPLSADFRLDYPDQLRVDEFMNEFQDFVAARKSGRGMELPQFVILRLPDDHTAGTQPGMPTPAASVADNDLAVGRVAEAVSHSPYWDDTVVCIVEDDAQDGADHVDAHRSIALVISKYAPGSAQHPAVDHNFYTTVSMVRTMEVLLGLPPMNNNDARASVIAGEFSGDGRQPPYTADRRNLKNGLIYKMNPPNAPGAKASLRMDFTHADAANAAKLNAILWRAAKGNQPLPAPRHTVFGKDIEP